MARVKRSVNAKKKRRKLMDRASGYGGARSRRYRTAREQVMHSMQYAHRDRRARKGQFRRLWIQRINAAARQNGTTYSRFMAGLKADILCEGHFGVTRGAQAVQEFILSYLPG